MLDRLACAGGLAASLLVAAPAAAHPGHGLETGGAGLAHFLLDFAHGGGALAAAVFVLAAVGLGKTLTTTLGKGFEKRPKKTRDETAVSRALRRREPR